MNSDSSSFRPFRTIEMNVADIIATQKQFIDCNSHIMETHSRDNECVFMSRTRYVMFPKYNVTE